ncbi:MAG: 4a-hydroxytetrahydrobiopterin dehydratase [Fidelibacterota bacterium]
MVEEQAAPGTDRLLDMRCEACRKGAPTVSEEEIGEFLPQVPGWEIEEHEGIRKVKRSYVFENFIQAMSFTNRVGKIAEDEGHHPALLTEWGRVTVTWWTHKIRGLHRNDFIMAAKTDQLY